MDNNSETICPKPFFSLKNLFFGVSVYALFAGPALFWMKFDTDTYREIILRDTPVYTVSMNAMAPAAPVQPTVPAAETGKATSPDTSTSAQTADAPTNIEQDAPPAPDNTKTTEPQDSVKPESSEQQPETKTENITNEPAAVPSAEKSSASQDYSSMKYPVEAPADGLYEKDKEGRVLPIKSADGHEPWKVYGRPFDVSSKKPRVAIIISDMGLSASSTDKAVSELPPEITLAFVPYAENLDEWIKKARNAGHETILSVPMEPETYPKDDPGPNALLTTLTADENTDRLHWALSRASGYVGIMNFMGSRFTADTGMMNGIIEDIRRRGLIIVDSAATSDSVIPALSRVQGVPHTVNDRYIDNIVSRQSIDKQLQYLEETARRRGYAVGIAFPYPITFERLNIWLSGLKDRGIEAVPITAAVNTKAE